MQNARKVMDMQPRELSAGACQKVMLVMSTILQPKVLIADEICFTILANHLQLRGDQM